MTLTFATWNALAAWLRQIEGLRRAACGPKRMRVTWRPV